MSVDTLVRLVNSEKMMLDNSGEVCFRRCVMSYEKEYLNTLEQSCVDRCTHKYVAMMRQAPEWSI